ncbi:MAG: MoaD/ThiS family protein [Halobacteriota archaeon]|nr:MoaD/ThiS family protein [Halobacteriota archaeon]
MRLRVKVNIICGDVSKRSLEVADDATYEDMLGELNINLETVVILKDKVPIPLDCRVSSGEITVLRVVSGG